MTDTTTHTATDHWHVCADLVDDTGTRVFPENLTAQQARDLADTLAHVDDVWDAVWVHACDETANCDFWSIVNAFDPDTAEPHWARTR